MEKKEETLLKSIIYTIFGISSLFFVNFNFSNFNYHALIISLVFIFISDNIVIKWKAQKILISNIVGIIISYIMGIEYLFISIFILLFRIKKVTLIYRYYRFIIYFNMYMWSAVIASHFGDLTGLFVFVTLAKIINSVLIGNYKNFELKLFIYEYIYFLLLIPYSYLYLKLSYVNSLYSHMILIINMIFMIAYYFVTRYMNEKTDEELKSSRLKRYNEIILELSNLLKEVSLKESEDKILKEISVILKEKMGFKYVLISLFDFSTGYITRVCQEGLEENFYNDIKEKKISINSAVEFFIEKYRYLYTYFIPHTDDISKENTFKIEENVSSINSENGKNLWNSDDLFFISLFNETNDVIGYVSLDEPLNGLRPTKEEMTILSVFSQLISLILINSKKYHEAVDLADSDGLTGLYNHTRLYKDIEFYEKTNEKIALIFFDIDNFKDLNDKKGHVYGDSILKAISAIFKENIRPEDRAYRYGGDEFVIILKDVNKFFSYEIIKRIIKITENLYPEITFSAGISDTYEIKKYKELINLSDERVYISKNTGKGKIIIK